MGRNFQAIRACDNYICTVQTIKYVLKIKMGIWKKQTSPHQNHQNLTLRGVRQISYRAMEMATLVRELCYQSVSSNDIQSFWRQ